MEATLRVTNIQRMCFHDGPGIRTTIFLKGCSIHCPWCANPENISFCKEKYLHNGKEEIYGRDYTSDELVAEVIKDIDFWSMGGGITFSGGEALMQPEGIRAVLEELKKKGVHTAIETALFVPFENLQSIIPLMDYFIVDIKLLDQHRCKTVLGGNLEAYFRNVRTVYEAGKLKVFRIPCCYEYTYEEDNKKKIVEFLLQYKDVKVELFGVHNLGKKKYDVLYKENRVFLAPDYSELNEFCKELKQRGINASVQQL